MMKIELEKENAYIYTPYNTRFVSKIKTAGGRWSSAKKAWYVNAHNVEAVRTIMRQVYGVDDTSLASDKLVRVRITLSRELSECTGPVQLFGKIVASAFGRDSGAKLGDDAFFEMGNAKSGGSAKNWETIIAAGSVIVLEKVPLAAIDAKIDWKDEYGSFEIIESDKIDVDALKTERDNLVKRLSEIDELLKKEC